MGDFAPGGFFLAFAVAAAVGWLLVHTRDRHLHLTGDHPASGPQKLHTHSTPRVGGLAVLAGFLAAVVWMVQPATDAPAAATSPLQMTGLLAGLLPLFALGLLEDISKAVSVRLRLGVALVAGALAYGLAGVRVQALGLPMIDALVHSVAPLSLLLPLAFTLVAVAGMVHAMNIVDGLNGLLAGITLVILGVLATVAWGFGDLPLVALCLAGIGATAGFAVFNFPRARLFCGDAGAYLIGYLIAVVVILLVQRHPTVSPWFALAVVIHPVTETLYSAWRRARLGMKATEPDARHMHSLWAARLRRRSEAGGQAVWLGTNASAAVRTAAVASLPVLLAATCPTQALALQLICAVYVLVFVAIVRWLDRPPVAAIESSRWSEDTS